ncbi:Hsp20/alpha crystallin family protein, partial [Bacillus pumilus]|uniref:Hsp20/alpha crystallin family protein n=1 Tax=Bacillus pumilus TaxID=1408 RepID=UPI0033152FEB
DEFFNNLPSAWGRDQHFNAPAVNIQESPEAFHLELIAPGLSKSDFKVTIENGTLSIAYEQEKSAENATFKTIRKEYSYQSFKRSFTLDDKINIDKIEAKYEDGILKLLMPKKPEARITSKEIAIL